MIVLAWSEMPVSKTIEFIKLFRMFFIIWSMLFGLSPLQQVGFLMRCSNRNDSKNFIIEYYYGLSRTSKTQILCKVLQKVNALLSSFRKEPLLVFGGLYVSKTNSFYFPRFISYVSISIKDANWEVSIFLHVMLWLM